MRVIQIRSSECVQISLAWYVWCNKWYANEKNIYILQREQLVEVLNLWKIQFAKIVFNTNIKWNRNPCDYKTFTQSRHDIHNSYYIFLNLNKKKTRIAVAWSDRNNKYKGRPPVINGGKYMRAKFSLCNWMQIITWIVFKNI